jgi:hypothetical protein
LVSAQANGGRPATARGGLVAYFLIGPTASGKSAAAQWLAERQDADILAALDAKPLFRHWTYNLTDGDPISGWLNAFHDGAALTRADFAGLEPLSRDDVVYCASGQAAQVLAAGEVRLAGGLGLQLGRLGKACRDAVGVDGDQ